MVRKELPVFVLLALVAVLLRDPAGSLLCGSRADLVGDPRTNPGLLDTTGTPAYYGCVSLQQGVSGYEGCRDTTISRWFPFTNVGEGALWTTGLDIAHILIDFDLQGLALPPGAMVLTAKLSLRTSSGGARARISAYMLKRRWEEMEATWKVPVSGEPWGAEGCSQPGVDLDPTPLDTVLVDEEEERFAWDVTGAVLSWLGNPATHFGLVLKVVGGDDVSHIFYYTSESPSDPTLRPKLEICYYLPTTTPTRPTTPTATPSVTPTATSHPVTNTPTATLTPTYRFTPTITPTPTETIPPRVYFSPDQAEIGLGSAREVSVVVENVEDLYAVELRVSFPSSLIQVIDADSSVPGVQIRDGDIFSGFHAYTIKNGVNNTTGQIEYIRSVAGSRVGKDGGGVIAIISLQGVTAGRGVMAFIEVVLCEQDGTDIPADYRNNRSDINVVSSTSTPTPTLPPGVTATPSSTPTGPAPTLPPPSMVRLVPAMSQIIVGETDLVQVEIADVCDLCGFDVRIDFNGARLDVEDADLETAGTQIFVGNVFDGFSYQIAQNEVTDDGLFGQAYLVVNLADVHPQGFCGTGIMLGMVFRGISAGWSNVMLSEVTLRDRGGALMPCLLSHGQVEVVQAPSATPSSTPTLTPTFTATLTPTSHTLCLPLLIKEGANMGRLPTGG